MWALGFRWALAIECVLPPARCSGRAVISGLTDVEEKYFVSNPIAAVKRYTDTVTVAWLSLFCLYLLSISVSL